MLQRILKIMVKIKIALTLQQVFRLFITTDFVRNVSTPTSTQRSGFPHSNVCRISN